MRSIVRRERGESYNEFLCGLAKASGLETPTREDLARLDRKRKKWMSNQEWKSPSDEDARIAKMKDGRTHLAHKAEHAVDLDTGAVVAVTLPGADQGDTTTLDETLGRGWRWRSWEPKPAEPAYSTTSTWIWWRDLAKRNVGVAGRLESTAIRGYIEP